MMKSKDLYFISADGVQIRIRLHLNTNTDHITISNEFSSTKHHYMKRKYLEHITIDGISIELRLCFNIETEHIYIDTNFRHRNNNGSKTNRACASFLGIHVAEQILSKMFDGIERMSCNNPGYDFTCKNGYKIDCKSSCLRGNKSNMWVFSIKNNKIPDFFLCLGFDNRHNLNPLHVWLIPSHILNNKSGTSISISTLNKWKQYEKSLDKVLIHCDTMKGNKDERYNK